MSLPEIIDDGLKARTLEVLQALQGDYAAADLATAAGLLVDLKNARAFLHLIQVAEALSRIEPNDPFTRRVYAQALIETGKVTAAIDVLRVLLGRLESGHREKLEATGLLGRAFKQIYFDSRFRSSLSARQALAQAFDAYRKPYEANPANTWHGVNLLALVEYCRRTGVSPPVDIDPRPLAAQLIATLLAVPEASRDDWYPPMVAEANLSTRNWTEVEDALHLYTGTPSVTSFQLNSTLRQFSKVWELENDERGEGVINILRARMMKLPHAVIEFSPLELRQLEEQPAPDRSQVEAILGSEGAKTFKWWQLGLERARSVASVRHKVSGRIGTAFLVRAEDFGLQPADGSLVLTNFHVVNPNGEEPGIPPKDAEIVFEAVDPSRVYGATQVLWSSPTSECDASLLRLDGTVADIEPMPLAKRLPLIEPTSRVYVIGYPGGRELAISFQDNELIDHEGPPAGKLQIPGVCRVHYRAPTEGGSSGSPVFNGVKWEVIALHHKGGLRGMPKLNGQAGTYAANEGVWMQSIIERIAAARTQSPASGTCPP